MNKGRKNRQHEQLDASVLVELFGKYKRIGNKRTRRIYTLTRDYLMTAKGLVVSIPALGEVTKNLVLETGFQDRGTIFNELVRIIETREIRLNSPQRHAYELVCQLMDHYQLEPQDALRIAEAIESEALRFITLDRELVKNTRLQEQYKLEISYPWGLKTL